MYGSPGFDSMLAISGPRTKNINMMPVSSSKRFKNLWSIAFQSFANFRPIYAYRRGSSRRQWELMTDWKLRTSNAGRNSCLCIRDSGESTLTMVWQDLNLTTPSCQRWLTTLCFNEPSSVELSIAYICARYAWCVYEGVGWCVGWRLESSVAVHRPIIRVFFGDGMHYHSR